MKDKIKQRKRELTLIIIISMVIIFFFSGFSMGKEFSKINIDTKTKIAKPILEVENNPIIDIKRTEEKAYYDFVVRNYDEAGNVTEVDLEYDIEILSNINENIFLKIYKEEREIDFENNKTERFLLSKEEKQEHHYKIEIMCSKEDVQEIIQEIQIKVHSEQKKV